MSITPVLINFGCRMRQIQPSKPRDLDPLAVELLGGLGAFPGARHLVLGGYFALKHYCDYRVTHNVAAWWSEESTGQDRDAVRAALLSVLTEIGQRRALDLKQRRFGDTESWELIRAGRKIFSMQIASRTVQLEPYLPSPWPPLQIESFADNVGSKMNALVQRGAPRDFLDIRQLVIAGLATPRECWPVWQRKNPDLKLAEARAEVARHLHELELRRPLETRVDPAERERAGETRRWFREVLLSGA